MDHLSEFAPLHFVLFWWELVKTFARGNRIVTNPAMLIHVVHAWSIEELLY